MITKKKFLHSFLFYTYVYICIYLIRFDIYMTTFLTGLFFVFAPLCVDLAGVLQHFFTWRRQAIGQCSASDAKAMATLSSWSRRPASKGGGWKLGLLAIFPLVQVSSLFSFSVRLYSVQFWPVLADLYICFHYELSSRHNQLLASFMPHCYTKQTNLQMLYKL